MWYLGHGAGGGEHRDAAMLELSLAQPLHVERPGDHEGVEPRVANLPPRPASGVHMLCLLRVGTPTNMGEGASGQLLPGGGLISTFLPSRSTWGASIGYACPQMISARALSH